MWEAIIIEYHDPASIDAGVKEFTAIQNRLIKINIYMNKSKIGFIQGLKGNRDYSLMIINERKALQQFFYMLKIDITKTEPEKAKKKALQKSRCPIFPVSSDPTFRRVNSGWQWNST